MIFVLDFRSEFRFRSNIQLDIFHTLILVMYSFCVLSNFFETIWNYWEDLIVRNGSVLSPRKPMDFFRTKEKKSFGYEFCCSIESCFSLSTNSSNITNKNKPISLLIRPTSCSFRLYLFRTIDNHHQINVSLCSTIDYFEITRSRP